MNTEAPKSNNVGPELSKIFNEDQAERVVGFDKIDFEKMRANDAVRLARAREIYNEVKAGDILLSAEELWYLGMLFQHSPNTDDYLIAAELANMSGEKGDDRGKWLSAAAEDRYLLNKGGKQKWGTQFWKNSGEEWKQLPIQDDAESGVTDEMRKEKNVPFRAEQLEVFLKRADI